MSLTGCPSNTRSNSSDSADNDSDSKSDGEFDVSQLIGEWRGSCWQVGPGDPWESGLDARRRLARESQDDDRSERGVRRPVDPAEEAALDELRRIDMHLRVESKHLSMESLRVAAVTLELHTPGEESAELRDSLFRIELDDDGGLNILRTERNSLKVESIEESTMQLAGRMATIGSATLGSGKMQITLQREASP